jgi:DNA-binding response OmpR family regulator
MEVKGRNIAVQRVPQRILVVDDEQDILEFLQAILEEEGYEVTTSDKGDYLEHIPLGRRPHLLLVDVLLSGKDGREIVKLLKNKEETKTIPIILFSAHASAEHTARQAGADDFLSKPFDLDILLAKVAHHLCLSPEEQA